MLSTFNERFRQIVFFAIILAIGILIFIQVKFLIPGFLGAITLYLLNRKYLYILVYNKKWNSYIATILIMLVDTIILLIPFVLAITFLVPKLSNFTNNAQELFEGIKEIVEHISSVIGIELLSEQNLNKLPTMLSSLLPDFFSSTINAFINLMFVFFLLFFLLINSSKIEKTLLKYIPLKPDNKKLVASETKNIITSYALGIPLLAIAQGICAYIGYLIFHIQDPILWAFVTCVCSVIPFVGSGLIWIPLVGFLYAGGHTENAIGLSIYCFIVVLNVDNVLRLFLLKAFADIHPLITLFGVITGLKLFGFIGLIFGPLLVSYLLLLIRIFVNEFSAPEHEIEKID